MRKTSTIVGNRNVKMRHEFTQELINIADWWIEHAQDNEQGGFYGEITIDNSPVANAPKGIVLATRLLWFFSEVAQQLDNPAYRAAAERAYRYLIDHFIDAQHGGVIWEVDAQGEALNTKKQVYAQAFAVYALVAYYSLTNNQHALDYALSCFSLMEKHTRDSVEGGYLEAFTREWGAMDDIRLSDKDLNFPKTMNTHLHIVEAYTSLYEKTHDAAVGAALQHGLECFEKYIINPETLHQRMFMEKDWSDRSEGYSYGHDIECSWLLYKALKSLNNATVSERMMPLVTGLADACLRDAMGPNGELIDAYDFATECYHPERVWWVQAEALIGFINTYKITGDKVYLTAAEGLWEFIKQYQIDSENGEWLWLSRLDSGYESQYKAGFWKCPYHNGRAMLEALNIFSSM